MISRDVLRVDEWQPFPGARSGYRVVEFASPHKRRRYLLGYVVLGHTLAVGVREPQIGLRGGVALLGSEAVAQ